MMTTADVSPEMLRDVTEHVNQSHANEVLDIARAFGVAWASGAQLIGFDLAGLELMVTAGSETVPLRVNFAEPMNNTSEIEAGFMETLAQARTMLGINVEENLIATLEAQSSLALPYPPASVFAVLTNVADYVAWLPPFGPLLEPTEALGLGSIFRLRPRGKQNASIRLQVTAFETNGVFEILELEGYAHRLRFVVAAEHSGSHLTVTVGNRVPRADSEVERATAKLKKLSGLIASKLEMRLKNLSTKPVPLEGER